MPSAVARSAKTPFATRRPASDDDDDAEVGLLAEDAAVLGEEDATTPPAAPPVCTPALDIYFMSARRNVISYSS